MNKKAELEKEINKINSFIDELICQHIRKNKRDLLKNLIQIKKNNLKYVCKLYNSPSEKMVLFVTIIFLLFYFMITKAISTKQVEFTNIAFIFYWNMIIYALILIVLQFICYCIIIIYAEKLYMYVQKFEYIENFATELVEPKHFVTLITGMVTISTWALYF